MNISQQEYEEKYDEYLRRVNKRIADEKLLTKRVKRSTKTWLNDDNDGDADDGGGDDTFDDLNTPATDGYVDDDDNDDDDYPIFLHSLKPSRFFFILFYFVLCLHFPLINPSIILISSFK